MPMIIVVWMPVSTGASDPGSCARPAPTPPAQAAATWITPWTYSFVLVTSNLPRSPTRRHRPPHRRPRPAPPLRVPRVGSPTRRQQRPLRRPPCHAERAQVAGGWSSRSASSLRRSCRTRRRCRARSDSCSTAFTQAAHLVSVVMNQWRSGRQGSDTCPRARRVRGPNLGECGVRQRKPSPRAAPTSNTSQALEGGQAGLPEPLHRGAHRAAVLDGRWHVAATSTRSVRSAPLQRHP